MQSGALAAGILCNGALSGTLDSVTVPPGADCTLDGALVLGNVTVQESARLRVFSSEIRGSIHSNAASVLKLNMELVGAGARAVRVLGNVLVNNSNYIEVSGLCDGNQIEGQVQVRGNTGQAFVIGDDDWCHSGNSVGLNLTILDNQNQVRPAANEIFGNLICLRNMPAPFVNGLRNTVHGKQVGQCESF
jgi:hypothetical protein